jgi:hypothetical protein
METISESQNCEFNLLFILSDTSHLIMVQTMNRMYINTEILNSGRRC